MLRFNFNNVYFKEFKIDNLLDQENKRNCSDFISLLGILYFHFTKRLSEKNIKVKLVVEWYENQVIDRGMIKGFHTFYKNTPIHGYQGYIISKDLHIYTQPNQSEFNSGVVPDKVFVTGDGLKNNILEFCDKINVDVAPGFRFKKVFEKNKKKEKNKIFSILLGLPIGLDDSMMILNMFINNMKHNINYFVKPHPTYSEDQIKSLFINNDFGSFQFVKGDFHNILNNVDLVVSNASSICLESLAKSVPVILIAPKTGIIQNPIPIEVSDKIWKLANNYQELDCYINYFKDLDYTNLENQFKFVKDNYFEPVTRRGILKFLNLKA